MEWTNKKRHHQARLGDSTLTTAQGSIDEAVVKKNSTIHVRSYTHVLMKTSCKHMCKLPIFIHVTCPVMHVLSWFVSGSAITKARETTSSEGTGAERALPAANPWVFSGFRVFLTIESCRKTESFWWNFGFTTLIPNSGLLGVPLFLGWIVI